MYYLAYGSNLNLEMLKARCGKVKVIGESQITDKRLVFKGTWEGYAYLTLEDAKDAFVNVGIFKINILQQKKLDIYEGYPDLYYKDYYTVNDKKSLIYIMNDKFNYHLPSMQYFDTCEQGFKEFGFNTDELYDAYAYTKEQMAKTRKKTK